jgi:hypothetical protein
MEFEIHCVVHTALCYNEQTLRAQIDVHTLPKGDLRVCHVGEGVGPMAVAECTKLGWETCALFNIENYGNRCGCMPSGHHWSGRRERAPCTQPMLCAFAVVKAQSLTVTLA